MREKQVRIAIVAVFTVLTLTACGDNPNETVPGDNEDHIERSDNTEEPASHDSHAEMNHSSSGEVPDNLQPAENPAYEVGSHAILQTDHMAGMQGAEATITGAYDTVAYVVTYTPTTGGEPVEHHKWVVHEEIEDAADDQVMAPGTEVVLLADHMEGMEGATATIEAAEETTVYTVTYTSTTSGEEVEHHKWVIESELAAE
ncbi:YdhK family protein [Alkalihalobacillus oceani]|uniref:YdhK family protein n=1 Tax=Halalkalibacter oceani TaxID=1653776 RepID=A0A9X2IMA9_9BACI|nr:YdhK family protein [Halalkalibacter oceani]MCM3712551.1 YdhK family protein [Halalkalibacter oceani]